MTDLDRLRASQNAESLELYRAEVTRITAERDELQAAVNRVQAWADGMETDIMGQPSIAGRAIAQAVRNALGGAS